jgi:hypothetical protein
VNFVVNVSPEVVDAGAEMTLHAELSRRPASDLRGQELVIKDHAGAGVGSMKFSNFDGETNETDEFVVKAPLTPGAYAWSAVYTETSTPISFTVKAHTTSVAVWDIPSAIVAGGRFRAKIGIKCSSNCQFASKSFAIYDHEGKQVSTAALSEGCWPGTSLHSAEVELEAPADEGLYTWTAKCPGSDAGLPHDEGSMGFGIRVVRSPEYVVTVETVDRESQTPLSGAHVVMHPYRAVTDEHGVAKLMVAKGAYKLFVSQTGYLIFGLPVEVTVDMMARAELELEPVLERN